MVAQHDPLRFLTGAPLFLTQDEESSGIIDATSILGPGWFLLDVQVVQGSTTAPLTEWLRLKVDPTTPAVFSWERNPR